MGRSSIGEQKVQIIEDADAMAVQRGAACRDNRGNNHNQDLAMAGYFGLVPAAGSGARMGEALPKQYLSIGNRPVALVRAAAPVRPCRRSDAPSWSCIPRISCFSAMTGVSLATDWCLCSAAARPGPKASCDGLERMRAEVSAEDWVLVHDAARPCLTDELLDRLIAELGQDEVGGLLAIPVADTLSATTASGACCAPSRARSCGRRRRPRCSASLRCSRRLRGADPARTTDEASAVEQLGPAAAAGDGQRREPEGDLSRGPRAGRADSEGIDVA